MSSSLKTQRSSSSANAFLYRIRDLVYEVAGIFQPDQKLNLLEARCLQRMHELGVHSLDEYYDCLTVKPIRTTELCVLLNEVTNGETCFFRSQAQLDALRHIVLPKIVQAKSTSPMRTLRIWSAGCSTGEEPYSLALLLMEEAELLKGWDVEIVATDLNDRALSQAQKGEYGEHALRNVTPIMRQRYFGRLGDRLRIHDRVKQIISFSRLNLLDDARVLFLSNMDLIFCCNVLIYFDANSKQRVIQHFYNKLLPHGYLFLGQSESLFGLSNDFSLVHFPMVTAYVRSEKRR